MRQDEGSARRPDAGGAEADVVHGSHRFTELEEIANPNGLVEDERQPADHVLQRLLSCKRDGDAADSEPGEGRGCVDPQVMKHGQAPGRNDNHVGHAAPEPQQRRNLADVRGFEPSHRRGRLARSGLGFRDTGAKHNRHKRTRRAESKPD
jgi:hypothetical protein